MKNFFVCLVGMGLLFYGPLMQACDSQLTFSSNGISSLYDCFKRVDDDTKGDGFEDLGLFAPEKSCYQFESRVQMTDELVADEDVKIFNELIVWQTKLLRCLPELLSQFMSRLNDRDCDSDEIVQKVVDHVVGTFGDQYNNLNKILEQENCGNVLEKYRQLGWFRNIYGYIGKMLTLSKKYEALKGKDGTLQEDYVEFREESENFVQEHANFWAKCVETYYGDEVEKELVAVACRCDQMILRCVLGALASNEAVALYPIDKCPLRDAASLISIGVDLGHIASVEDSEGKGVLGGGHLFCQRGSIISLMHNPVDSSEVRLENSVVQDLVKGVSVCRGGIRYNGKFKLTSGLLVKDDCDSRAAWDLLAQIVAASLRAGLSGDQQNLVEGSENCWLTGQEVDSAGKDEYTFKKTFIYRFESGLDMLMQFIETKILGRRKFSLHTAFPLVITGKKIFITPSSGASIGSDMRIMDLAQKSLHETLCFSKRVISAFNNRLKRNKMTTFCREIEAKCWHLIELLHYVQGKKLAATLGSFEAAKYTSPASLGVFVAPVIYCSRDGSCLTVINSDAGDFHSITYEKDSPVDAFLGRCCSQKLDDSSFVSELNKLLTVSSVSIVL